MDAATTQLLERIVLLAPHPVAVAAGRVLRAHTLPERLDAILRAGEALTRYTAALALASLSARTDTTVPLPAGLGDFDGNLSWGSFLTVIEQVSTLPDNAHPLAAILRSLFRPNRRGVRPGFDPLQKLLRLRNELGHDLQALSPARAEVVFRTETPDATLATALETLQPLLDLPLFLVEEQRLERGTIQARRLLLMGESENPRPDTATVSSGVNETQALHLGLHQGALTLWPWLCWDLSERRVTYAVYVIHGITNRLIKFKSMFGDSLERNSVLRTAVTELRAGRLRPLDACSLADGRSFAEEWHEIRRQQEEALAQRGGPIPWNQLDTATVAWYAARLPGANAGGDPRQTIQASLLNGRDFLRVDEVTQMLLLFGTPDAVRQALGREMLDCRARGNSDARWDERDLVEHNAIESLRSSVQFFGRHVGIDGVTLDGLEATAGAADYIAMREALVNLFIHQDYTNAGVVAQIEIAPERAVFFNAGKSLVSREGLVDGGKSQSRNPLMARALRLIGFAELAGSGLRALQNEWRKERRRPPRFDSDDASNTFTLTLDWRMVPVVLDSFWKEKLGVQVTPQQARILSLLAAPEGFTAEEIASGTGMLLEDVPGELSYLQIQSLVKHDDARYALREDLRTLVQSKPKNE
ncbi:MAG: hypothetical protein KDD91_07790 [Caldilinea sp.]|nr:hypothetical protein [Caldilinea sp.]